MVITQYAPVKMVLSLGQMENPVPLFIHVTLEMEDVDRFVSKMVTMQFALVKMVLNLDPMENPVLRKVVQLTSTWL